jgi:hypothetical protein
MTSLTQTVTSEEEMIRLRRNTEQKQNDDIAEWLLVQRDHHASVYQQEFQKGDLADYAVINPANELADRYARAAEEIAKSRVMIANLTEALRSRVLVQLADAKAPPWTPTHVHYKGKGYRFLRVVKCADHEELEPMVEYDDSEGEVYVLSQNRWESMTGTGKPRYRYVGLAKEDM